MVKYTPEMVRRKEKMNKVELGERVKAIREHYGLTQSQFAQKIKSGRNLQK